MVDQQKKIEYICEEEGTFRNHENKGDKQIK